VNELPLHRFEAFVQDLGKCPRRGRAEERLRRLGPQAGTCDRAAVAIGSPDAALVDVEAEGVVHPDRALYVFPFKGFPVAAVKLEGDDEIPNVHPTLGVDDEAVLERVMPERVDDRASDFLNKLPSGYLIVHGMHGKIEKVGAASVADAGAQGVEGVHGDLLTGWKKGDTAAGGKSQCRLARRSVFVSIGAVNPVKRRFSATSQVSASVARRR
jgi:hypothetical protein